MASLGRTFRVFVSSTFNDLKAERNALQSYVFPRLRELSQQFGARFQPIDLRWGVSSEASLDQQAMQICLDEIERCKNISPRPNFIILMGDRYGWLPPMARIPQQEFEIIRNSVNENEKRLLDEWYEPDRNAIPPEYRLKPRESDGKYQDYEDWQPIEAQLHDILARAVKSLSLSGEQFAPYWASATHQEIISGALTQRGAGEHVFCFIRDIKGLPHEFNFSAFLEILKYRLERKYPQGLSLSFQNLLNEFTELDAASSAGEASSFIIRQIKNTAQATPERDFLQFIEQALIDFTGKDYVNMDETTWEMDGSARENLANLKAQLRSEFGAKVLSVDNVQWIAGHPAESNNQYQCITLDHIGTLPDKLDDCRLILAKDYQPKNLCEATFQHLGNIILSDVNRDEGRPSRESIHHYQVDEALDQEGIEHLAFAEARIRHFVGRDNLLGGIQEYISEKGGRLFAIAGEGGSGKSALMAKALQMTQTRSSGQQVIFRFIGATPASSDGRALLEGLCHEIARRYGQDEEKLPSDYLGLVSEFGKLLALASNDKPMIIFLDSLDQLSANHGARNLHWLPESLPKEVAIIVSTRMDEDTFANLVQKQIILKELVGLSHMEGETLLDAWLNDAHRALTSNQRDEVLEKFKASNSNPLYLKLAFEEARLWTSYQPLEHLAIGVRGIIKENMFDRLSNEGNHGEVLVSHALGYLAASRNGLSEDELVDLLSRDPDVYEWFFNQTYHLPADLLTLTIDYLEEHPDFASQILAESHLEGERLAMAWLKQKRTPPEPVREFIREVIQQENGPRLPIVLWSRLSFDLDPYLTNRTVDNYTLLSFFHREIGEVASEAFLEGNANTTFHSKLAKYFLDKADPRDDRSWQGTSIHALSEIPYHLSEAGERDNLFSVLTDFSFMEQKVEKVGITQRIDENGRTLINSDGVHQLEQDFKFALEKLYGSDSEDAHQAPLILTAENMDGKLTLFCPVCNNTMSITEDLLGKNLICPSEGCNTPLKINPFVIEKSR